jgi:aminoglycoside 2'-N-acetyltransferase I
VITVRTAHTADVPADVLAAARKLVADAFADQFNDQDWEHSLGGR